MGTMGVNFDFIFFDGDLPDSDDQAAQRMTFQPGLPYPLSDTMNLFVRPAFPLIFKQDVPRAGGGFNSKGLDLGDIGFDVAVGKTFRNGIMMLGGLVTTTVVSLFVIPALYLSLRVSRRQEVFAGAEAA